MGTNQVVIYGIGGADKAYGVLKVYTIFDTTMDVVKTIVNTAQWMKATNPSIMAVYAIDNYRGLKRDYQKCSKENSIESNYLFRDILERQGWRVI